MEKYVYVSLTVPPVYINKKWDWFTKQHEDGWELVCPDTSPVINGYSRSDNQKYIFRKKTFVTPKNETKAII